MKAQFSSILIHLTIAALSCSPVLSSQTNRFPVVLVHGFAGWGRDEMLNVKYWGGLQGDYQEKLKKDGHQVFTATVGPFSSNWDRACELFAQIKGGKVNYGPNHSKKFSHKKDGKYFKGLYPEWGTKTQTGEVKKIHLIGHSMGGQTIRMLAQMLANGTTGAFVEESKSSSHPLFRGGNADWVHSITTVSTPHQGTLLADAVGTHGDVIVGFVAKFFSFLYTFGGASTNLFDAKLDHYNISPKKRNERIGAYIKRVFSSSIFRPGFRDISLYDMTLKGSRELNMWVKTVPSIYYYTFSNEASFKGKFLYQFRLRDVHYPRLSMLPPMAPVSKLIGGIYCSVIKKLPNFWLQNDGLVNTYSMRGAHNSNVVRFSGKSLPGRFHDMGVLPRKDHADVIGLSTLDSGIYQLYLSHIKLLKNLPPQTNTRSLRST